MKQIVPVFAAVVALAALALGVYNRVEPVTAFNHDVTVSGSVMAASVNVGAP